MTEGAVHLELLLFTTEVGFLQESIAAGVDGAVVDWESRGKEARQIDADTQVNHDTVDDLRRVRGATAAKVICRLNGNGEWTPDEIDLAIEAGADELLLPMVRRVVEVERVLDRVGGRCPVGILVETRAATTIAPELARLPLARAYVGLNDLAIERGHRNIFSALADGTVERIRAAFASVPFGFGGLTLPELGHPVACRLLLAEMVRLDCRFTFLRRSYLRDVSGRDQRAAVASIRAATTRSRGRPPEAIERDRRELVAAVAEAGSALMGNSR